MTQKQVTRFSLNACPGQPAVTATEADEMALVVRMPKKVEQKVEQEVSAAAEAANEEAQVAGVDVVVDGVAAPNTHPRLSPVVRFT